MIRYLLLLLFLFQTSKVLALACKDRIAIVPPYVKDPVYGDWLIQESKDFILRKERMNCEIFADTDRVAEYFSYSGISSFFTRSLETKQIKFIQKNIGANYLLIISQENDKRLYKLYRIEDAQLKLIQTYTNTEPQRQVKSTPSLVNWLSSVTPNAFALKVAQSVPSFDLDDNYREVEEDPRDGYKRFAYGFSISKIDHSSAFEPFDFSASVFPGLFFYAVNQTTLIEEKNPAAGTMPKQEKLRFRGTGLCIDVNGEVAFYWPLGTTFMGMGLGPCYIHSAHGNNEPDLLVPIIPRIFLGHRVFLTQNSYAELSAEGIFSEQMYTSPLVKSAGVINSSLSFGWYFPDVERRSLKAWNKLN